MSINPFQRRKETIEDILGPLATIVTRLRQFREDALTEAEQNEAEAKAALDRAGDLRKQGDEAKRLADKYA